VTSKKIIKKKRPAFFGDFFFVAPLPAARVAGDERVVLLNSASSLTEGSRPQPKHALRNRGIELP
jgi:hypothetical protein